jgi:hypothetical protein
MDQVEKEIETQTDFFREISCETGDSFFRSLAKNVSKAARSYGAMVAEFAGAAGTRMRTIAVCMHGGFVDNFNYDLPRNLWDCDLRLPVPFWISDMEGLPHFSNATAGAGLKECAVWPLADSSNRSLGLLIIFHPQHRAAQGAVQERRVCWNFLPGGRRSARYWRAWLRLPRRTRETFFARFYCWTRMEKASGLPRRQAFLRDTGN